MNTTTEVFRQLKREVEAKRREERRKRLIRAGWLKPHPGDFIVSGKSLRVRDLGECGRAGCDAALSTVVI